MTRATAVTPANHRSVLRLKEKPMNVSAANSTARITQTINEVRPEVTSMSHPPPSQQLREKIPPFDCHAAMNYQKPGAVPELLSPLGNRRLFK